MLDFRTQLAACLILIGSSIGHTPVMAQTQPSKEAPRKAEPPERKAEPPERRERGGVEVDLRPKFQSGRVSRYEMSIVSGNEVRSDGEGMDQDQTMTQTIDLSVKVKSVNDEGDGGGATLEIVYDRIRAVMETADYKAEFDSGKPAKAPTGKAPIPPTPNKSTRPAPTAPAKTGKPGGGKPTPTRGNDPEMDDMLAQIMRPMVGTTLTMQVDKEGNIKSVTGGDALGGAGLGALLGGGGGLGGLGGGGMSPPVPGAGGAGGAGPMGWIVNSPGQKSVVRVGETWTNNDSLGGTPIGGFKMVTRHRCDSVSETKGGKSANLSFSGRADQESMDGAAGGAGFKLKESAYNGQYVWDMVKGELKSMTSTLKTAIEANISSNTLRMKADTKMTVKRLD